MKRLTLFVALCCSLAAPNVASAAIELITNGDFSADLVDWTVTNNPDGSGNWYADDVGTMTPTQEQPTAPSGGGRYAVSDTSGPGVHALEQTFTVPGVAESVILTFDMFMNNYADITTDDSGGLDYLFNPNQYVRVDILTNLAGSLDTDNTSIVASLDLDLLSNFPLLDINDPVPNSFVSYSFDVTSAINSYLTLSSSNALKLRFAAVDNQFFLNMGVDNVSIQFTPLPEPMTLAVWSTLATLGGVIAWRKRGTR